MFNRDTNMKPLIIGVSQHIENINKLIEKTATTEENVLVLGEKGVGKDLVVQNLYHRSKRVGKPFVKINCAQNYTIGNSCIQSGSIEGKFLPFKTIYLQTFE
jgi:transcriptional regulator with GAF, ATPase, and Fis domain